MLAVLLLSGCNRTSYETIYPTLSDGKYDSEFPYRNCSEQLEEIASSLVKIDVLVFYETFSFSIDDQLTLSQLRTTTKKVQDLGGIRNIFTESVGGTGITIYNENERVGFLSCAHLVEYPDTVINYFPYPDNEYIQVIGIKARQSNNISTLQEGRDLKILAMDQEADIVFLGKEYSAADVNLQVFSYPVGETRELEWGSFVYIMGYPLGHAMITRGIVSNPERINKGSFLIDAVFNKGFSGGPVIAVRDGVPNFEMVGMVRSSAATRKFYLVPEDSENIPEMNFNEPYQGKLKLISENEIKYGITFSITTRSIRHFFDKNRKQLAEKGYSLEGFFMNND
jgi:hypothetical protein